MTTTTTINVRGVEEGLWLEFGARAIRLKLTRTELLNQVLRHFLANQAAAERGQSIQEVAYAAGVAAGRGLK